MEKRTICVLGLLCIAGLLPAGQQGVFENLQFVNTMGGLAVRALPSTGAPILFVLPDGELIEYYGSPTRALVAGRQGYWIRIRWKDRQGFVFSAFLEGASGNNRLTPPYTLLLVFSSYNRRTRLGSLLFRTGHVGEGTYGEFSHTPGKIVITQVVPPAAYCRYVFTGPLATRRTLQRLQKGSLVTLRFRLDHAAWKDRPAEGIAVSLTARILTVTESGP